MDAVELIQLYETLFYVCAALTVLGFGLAIFFFFFFRIPDVRALMTGKARADTVRRIEEQNAKTGTLRTPVPGTSGEIGRSEKIGRTGRTIIENPAPPQSVAAQPVQYNDETAVLQSNAAETSVLASDETVVLHNSDTAETSLLHRAPADIRFDITEATIVIHTDEMI